jgi:hypothetical protein
MALADGSRIQLSRRATGAGSGNGDILRYVSHGLNPSQNSITSEEVNSDRMVTDLKNVSSGATGSLSLEYSYKNLTPELESAFYSTFSTVTLTTSTVSAADEYNSLNDATEDLSIFLPGTWVNVSGFTETANNGLAKVVSSTTDKLVLSYIDLVDEVLGDSVTISSSLLINGTTEQAYDYEELDESSSKYFTYTNMVVNTFTLDATPQEKITASADLLGTAFDNPSGTIFDGYDAAVTTPIMDTSNNVISLMIGGVEYNVQSANINISNGNRLQTVVGSGTAAGIGAGKMEITGSVAIYFSSAADTLFTAFKNNTETDFDLVMTDDLGNSEIWSIPAVKFTEIDKPNAGTESDYIFTFSFGAKVDATGDKQMVISRIDV